MNISNSLSIRKLTMGKRVAVSDLHRGRHAPPGMLRFALGFAAWYGGPLLSRGSAIPTIVPALGRCVTKYKLGGGPLSPSRSMPRIRQLEGVRMRRCFADSACPLCSYVPCLCRAACEYVCSCSGAWRCLGQHRRREPGEIVQDPSLKLRSTR